MRPIHQSYGDGGGYEYALDAANSAAKHLQAILAELPATSPLARGATKSVANGDPQIA